MDFSTLNLYHLKYFQDVARLQSFSKAATLNFVSRPAISKAIFRLEEVIGYKLFEHQKKVTNLTKDGQQLVESLEPVLAQLERVIKRQISSTQLRIGVSYSIFRSLLQKQLSSFLSTQEHNKLDIKFGTSKQLIGLIVSKEIEFAILIEHQDGRMFNSHELHSGQFILVSPKTNRNENTLITTEDRHETLLIGHLHGNKFARHIKVASWSACVDLVLSHAGVGLIPDFLFDRRTMKRHRLKENLPYTVWAVWLPETDPDVFLRMLNKG
jgi:DNA-binding transcriptional LysR family regulator